jgi:hypothetical protein
LANAPAPEQLGAVNPKPSSNGGIFFWGTVSKDPSGKIDPKNSRLHLEVFDDKYERLDSKGKPLGPLVFHIGPEQEGYAGVDVGKDHVVFGALWGAVRLEGDLHADPFTGIMYFSTPDTSFEWHPLGRFEVTREGFFKF